MTNSITSDLLLSNYQKPEKKTGSDILGKDDFLKILMVQLQNQDPMNPMQDKDFIAQMATFSTLEQITNMGKSFEKFAAVQEQNQMIAYSQFVGKDITWHKIKEPSDPKDPDAKPEIIEGKGRVASLKFLGDKVVFVLEDGTEIESGNISQVDQVSKESQLTQASMLIGKTVTYQDADEQEKSAVVKSVSIKDGKTLFQLDNGESIQSNQMTKIAA